MKSSQLLNIPSTAVVPRIRRSKSFAALFAAALAMGLGVGSVLAQGPYYPQVAPLGGAPFIPNGVPVVSNAELNLIESKMTGGATLVIPALAPKHPASLAEYKAAVQAAAADVANGAGGPVTIATLASEVSVYRQAGASQVIDGLGSFAAGIIASSSATKATDLQGLVFNAAKTNPAAVNSGNLFLQVFNAAAADNTLVTGIGALVNSALTGAVAGTPPAAALGSAGVKSVIYNAINAIGNAPTTNANTANNTSKGNLITNVVTTIIPTIAGSPVNLSQATSTLTGINVTTYVTTATMVSAIKNSVAASSLNYGAIAQGALLGLPSASAAIKAALNTSYTNDLIDAFNAFATPGNASALALAYDPVAVAAAGGTKFPGSASSIVKDVLFNSNASGGQAQDIIGRGIAAAVGQPAQNIAAASVGSNPFVTLSDVITGATLGAPIGSAGAIARAVAVTPLAGGLTPVNATTIGNAAIAAAASASPSYKEDAYADVAFNLASTGGNAAYQNSAITAEAQAIATANGGPATAPTYIAIVAAAAGSPANRATILSTGTGAVVGDDDAASTAGVNLLTNLSTGGALSKFQATLAAVATAGNDARNLALIYAAELGNTADSAGGLAAVIANTATNATDLTIAAISANRLIRANLKVASDVAVYAKANPNGNIQAYLGHQILDNPSFTKEIAVAATTVTPQWSHVIAHTLAFDAPKAVVDSISGIFLHSRIPLLNGAVNYVNDRPAAVAAITAAVTTGILENTITPTFTAADRKLALVNAISKSMTAIVSGGFNSASFNDATVGPNNFRQSDGSIGGSTTIKATGAAGAVTGFVAQLVTPGVNAIDPDVVGASGALAAAMAAAAQYTGGTYILDIAQAAGQAFGWVSGTANSILGAAVASQIAAAVNAGFPSYDLANPGKVLNAVKFGIDEAKGGEIAGNPLRLPGAGAGGLRDIGFNPLAPFYDHHTASGRPVSNIFSL